MMMMMYVIMSIMMPIMTGFDDDGGDNYNSDDADDYDNDDNDDLL